MLHRPAVSNGRAVVTCNALGFEGLLAYRPFRHLADRLVARGFTVLRFDYAGTGDSDGGEWESGCVKAWLGSIGEAVEVARSIDGVTDVQLVGFRMGATLAAVYAAEHPGISGLALWVPCVTGKGFVRELGALGRLSAANRPPQRVAPDWFPADSLEAVGFEFTAATLDELRDIDLRASGSQRPAPAALVLDRDDAPGSNHLVAGLAAAGVAVDHQVVGGYLDFVTDDETTSTLPDAALDLLAEWLDMTQPRPRARPTRALAVGHRLLVEDGSASHLFAPGSDGEPSHEEAVWTDRGLFAIVSRPVRPGPRSDRVVLILNTGSANRAGPGRLHVTLARRWAALGFTVVRVDLGGTGDSVAADPATENLPYDAERVLDSLDVVGWIRRELDCAELTVFGVCSGAYHAFRLAHDGAAVDRIVLVNQLIFSRHGLVAGESNDAAVLSANLLTRGVGSVDRWRRLATGEVKVGEVVARLQQLVAAGALTGFGEMAKASAHNLAVRVGLRSDVAAGLAAELRSVTDAGVDVVYVFAADEPGMRFVRLMGGAVGERLIAEGRVALVEIDGGDHVFSPPGARQALIETVTGVLTDRSKEPARGS